jgi:hypothetical protein
MIRTASGKGLLSAVFLLLAIFFLNSCGSSSSSGGSSAPFITKIEVLPYEYSMKVGTTQQYYAVAIYSDSSKEDITESATWGSSNASVAEVVLDGKVNALDTGTTRISASQAGRTGQTTLTVHDKPTVALSILPAEATLPLGSITPFRAVAIFDDGTQQNVVYDVEASLKNDSGIIVPALDLLRTGEQNPVLDQYALAEAVLAGSDTLIALFDGVTGTSDITVVDEIRLEQVVVEPSSVITTVGILTEFFATGIYSDGSSRDLTETVSWGSSDTLVASISNTPNEKGIATSLAPGKTTISATLDALGGTAALTVNNETTPELTSIVIDPPVAMILPNEIVSYKAFAIFSNNSFEEITTEATWTSSNETVAVIGNEAEYVGKALGLTTGEATIAATYKGVDSNNGVLTVKPPEVTLERIDIAPSGASIPKGTLLAYNAIAFYSDGTTADVTVDTTWESSDVRVAYIVTASVLAGTTYAVAEGTAQVQGSYQGQSASTGVTVTPAVLRNIFLDPVNPSVPAGTILRYRAIGIYSDLTFADLTLLATWQSSNSSVATVSNRGAAAGLVVTLNPGTTTLNATLDGVTGTSALEATPAILQSIQVAPAAVSQAAGTDVAFEATAIYSNGGSTDVTGEVTWASSDSAIVHISNDPASPGLAAALVVGNAVITATLDTFSDTANFEVTPAILVEVSVAPVVNTLPEGAMDRYKATGIYSDNSSDDITLVSSFRSSNPTVAETVGSGGRNGYVEARATGNASIIANHQGIEGSGILEVSTAQAIRIQIIPANISLPAGSIVQYSASALYTNGEVEDITEAATWTSSDSSVVSIITSGASAGSAALLQVGTAEITATLNGLSNTVPVQVNPAVIVDIQVSPTVESVSSGIKVQYSATGVYSDGTNQPLDDEVTWQSSNHVVADINAAGLAQTFAPGEAIILASTPEATAEDINGEATLEVTSAEVVSIQITPKGIEEPIGTEKNHIATALLTNDATEDVTTDATWISSDPSIVSIVTTGEGAGQASLLQPGTADITAALGAITDTTTITVTPAVLVEIQVSPQRTNTPSGVDVQYSASGIYSDGSFTDLTNEATWLSNNLTVATIDQNGLAQSLSPGATLVSASYEGFSGAVLLRVSAAIVTAIQITPAGLEEPTGTSSNLTALAELSDGSTEDVTGICSWLSSAPGIVTVVTGGEDAGLATLLSPGTASISATFDEIPGAVEVVVTAAELTEIQVSPLLEQIPAGLSVVYTARGIYTDGTNTVINADVSWRSFNDTAATIDPTGFATGLAPGATIISATLDDIVGKAALDVTNAKATEIQVTPGNLVEPAGSSGNLTATALLTDGTTNDITKEATWTSSAPDIASVTSGGDDAGLVLLEAVGTATITASSNSQNDLVGTTNIEVTAAVLIEVAISPVLYERPSGRSVQFTADGVYSDGSRTPIGNDVDWISSDVTVATIEEDGLAEGIRVGEVTITATHPDGKFNTTTLTITPAVFDHLEIAPQNLSMANGTSEQLIATAIYSDASTDNVTDDATWTSSNGTIAIVDNGVVTSVNEGVVVITASIISGARDSRAAFDDTANVTVTPAILQEITVSTEEPTIRVGDASQFIATGEYSDQSLQDITTNSQWTSTDPSIALASNAEGEEGLVYGEGVGETIIQASLGGISDSSPIIVTDAGVVSIALDPEDAITPLGLVVEYTATATYSDGRTEEITDRAIWQSSNTAIVEIDANGVAVSRDSGTVTITATEEGVIGSTTLTADALLPPNFSIEPPSAQIAIGTDYQFSAIIDVTGSDNEDITNQVVWTSADPSIATISNAEETEGLAEAVSPGAVEISALYTYIPTGELFEAFATLEVVDVSNDRPDYVEVAPVTPSIAENATQQFTLTGFWEVSPGNYFQQDLTTAQQTNWKSSDKQTASITKNGLATGLKADTTTIEGSYKGLTDSTDLTVTP